MQIGSLLLAGATPRGNRSCLLTELAEAAAEKRSYGFGVPAVFGDEPRRLGRLRGETQRLLEQLESKRRVAVSLCSPEKSRSAHCLREAPGPLALRNGYD
ncbi:Hypothetical protein SMAX5B_011745 [Scophthalmus maximus]|uniref:Uncharacterized protein n=1 Tax=Scophthalmus maximus TaxID=52904 RepID=A0A2U9AY39_SCOMX|nr:Hypothetical protein SMAX5B_011745 [Scophthalmus maximus]